MEKASDDPCRSVKRLQVFPTRLMPCMPPAPSKNRSYCSEIQSGERRDRMRPGGAHDRDGQTVDRSCIASLSQGSRIAASVYGCRRKLDSSTITSRSVFLASVALATQFDRTASILERSGNPTDRPIAGNRGTRRRESHPRVCWNSGPADLLTLCKGERFIGASDSVDPMGARCICETEPVSMAGIGRD